MSKQDDELRRIINKFKRGTWDEDYTIKAINAHCIPKQDDELVDYCMMMFGVGKELSEIYQKYTGDMDWSNWLADMIPRIDLIPEMRKYAIPKAEVLRAIPQPKHPYAINSLPNFIEPIVAESINTEGTVEPWVNKGYNRAITDITEALGLTSKEAGE